MPRQRRRPQALGHPIDLQPPASRGRICLMCTRHQFEIIENSSGSPRPVWREELFDAFRRRWEKEEVKNRVEAGVIVVDVAIEAESQFPDPLLRRLRYDANLGESIERILVGASPSETLPLGREEQFGWTISAFRLNIYEIVAHNQTARQERGPEEDPADLVGAAMTPLSDPALEERVILGRLEALLKVHPERVNRFLEEVTSLVEQYGPTDTAKRHETESWATERLIGTPQAAEILGITPTRVQQHAQKGRIGELVGGRYLFSAAELEAFKNRVKPKGGRPTKSREENS